MGTECPECGMESDRDDICTWCNADLSAKQQKKGSAASEQAGARGEASADSKAAGRRGADTTTSADTQQQPQTDTSSPSRPPWLIPLIVSASFIFLLVGGLLYMGYAASGPSPEAGKWKTFKGPNGYLSGYYPAGWGEPVISGRKSKFVKVRWKGTNLCKVIVRGSAMIGAMGDADAASERASGGDVRVGKSTSGQLLQHFGADAWKNKRPGYEQSQPQYSYQFAGKRKARVTYEYTKRVGLLPIKMKGMRFGHHAGEYSYHVVAEAPAQHWDKFKPIALRILKYCRAQ